MSADINEIDTKELSQLIERVGHAIENDLALSIEDMKLLLSAIITLSTLQQKMEQDDVTLHKLRKLLGMVQQSEKRRSKRPSKNNRSDKNNKRKRTNKKKPPPVVHHPMIEYSKGQCCPDCGRGKLYKHEPGNLLRVTGHLPYEAVQHVTEQLRCNACQVIHKAPLPKEVLEDGDSNQKYGYSARALMVIDKFYSGLPYYHQGNLAEIFGQTLTASTVFDQCEHVANSCMPVFYELKRLAANADQFLLDDTHNKILSQQPEMRDTPNGKGKRLRNDVYSSGLIARLSDGNEIVLFETSLGHAGEHLDSILAKRDPSLPVPLAMSDALSSNLVTKQAVRHGFCNAHARRQFVDLERLYPKDIEWLLETYAIIWERDSKAKEKGLSHQKRLAYHKKHSLPAMKSIKDWALKKQSSKAFEEHGALGKAIAYFLRHYEKLTLFCQEPGALIDNNAMEEKIKIIIRGRKTSHFYKTAVGAGVANVLISLIATAYGGEVSIFDYLQALQKNQEAVKKNPAQWMPWNYTQALDAPIQESPPEKMAA